MFFFKSKKRFKIHISIIPKNKGGGANTFSYNFIQWLKENSDHYVFEKNIEKAEKAIVIANKGNIDSVFKAKRNGCFLIHRLDEHFEDNETGYRKEKHDHIKTINQYADVTVYQSNYVFQNVHPHINPKRFEIIINGGNQNTFFPASKTGSYIGHVSWGYDKKKRLDLLYKTINDYPNEKFLLIGNHRLSQYPFDKCTNAVIKGPIKRANLTKLYHQMKILFFPSEKDPCPNTAVESILCGVPVCYHIDGGTKEIVQDCGLPLDQIETLLKNISLYRTRCLKRDDLCFDNVARKYLSLEIANQ